VRASCTARAGRVGAEITITAASATLAPDFISPTKSAYPGASSTFSLCPFHSIGSTDVLVLIFRPRGFLGKREDKRA
jgi:hypothetical protein